VQAAGPVAERGCAGHVGRVLGELLCQVAAALLRASCVGSVDVQW
jgi:hypothetical protein